MEVFIGAAVSILVEWIKSKTNLGGWKTMAVLLLVSLIVAVIYTALVFTGYWQTVLGILITAGAFYTFVIERFKS